MARCVVGTTCAYRFPCGKAQRFGVPPLPQKAYRAFRGPRMFESLVRLYSYKKERTKLSLSLFLYGAL